MEVALIGITTALHYETSSVAHLLKESVRESSTLTFQAMAQIATDLPLLETFILVLEMPDLGGETKGMIAGMIEIEAKVMHLVPPNLGRS
jgi:hypothetical protein